MHNIELYYFTGTGNTLYLVNQLQERIPELSAIPVASLLDIDGMVRPKSKVIGFCFPNHAGHLPLPMKMMIKKLRLEGDEYLFAICNSAFSKSFALDDINRILSKNNGKLSSFFNLTMPDNHTIGDKGYIVPGKEHFERCAHQAQERLDNIKEVISRREIHVDKDDRPRPFPVWIDKTLRPLIFFLVQHYPALVLKGALYADAKCIGCKICERVCPANRIAVHDGRPVFDHTKPCFGCYGCINYCPQESIQGASKWYNGRSYTTENGRYPHPFASVSEIEKQKKRSLDTKSAK